MGELTTSTPDTEQNTLQAPATEAQEQQTPGDTPEKMNALQKFIDGLLGGKKETGDAKDKDTSAGDAQGEGDIKTTFTQEDVDAAIEAAKQKWTEEAAEAERVKKLSPEERAAEEQQKKDDEITSLRSQLLKKELQEKAVKALEKEGFPVGLSGTLDYSSEESMKASLENTTKIFRESLAAAVQARLKGKTPEGLGNAASAENLLRDQIAKNVRGL